MSRVLADTSVWVNHLQSPNAELSHLLDSNRVLCHPFVIGELACGNLANRHEILTRLSHLPQAILARDAEVLSFIERWKLAGTGVGYIDAHLLASATITGQTLFWVKDKRAQSAARALNLNYDLAN